LVFLLRPLRSEIRFHQGILRGAFFGSFATDLILKDLGLAQ